MKKLIFVLSIFIFFQSFILGQLVLQSSPQSAGMSAKKISLLDAHIQKFINEGNLPGGVFLVARKGKVVYFKNHGHQDLDKKNAYQKDDIFRLASMTKAVTTVGIMQLYEQGKLGLDDPIFYYIPAFAKPQILDTFNEADSSFTTKPSTKPITIRHLLTHTSGITYGSFNPGKIQAVYEKVGASDLGLSHHKMTTEDMANQIAKVPLVFEPGSQYMYGLNMEVLGRIIEVVSGMTLDNYFQKNIFDPLGMKSTHFYLPKEFHKNLVPVYTYNDQGKIIMASGDTKTFLDYPKSENRNHFAGGGGLSGTTLDYAVFIQALINGGQLNGNRILSRKSIEVMTSDQLILLNKKGTGYSKIPGKTYGLGFALTTDEGSAASHKSPGTYEWGGYFNTKFFIDPAEELIFVGMTQVVPFQRNDFWSKMYAIIYSSID